MKFCHHCAGPVSHHIPEGEDRLRYACLSCDVIFYQNPNNIVGTLPVYEDRVLLCRRAIEPRYGLWTLPAGFMENGETSLAGAIRETREEARANVAVDDDCLYTLFNLPYINQVYLFFRARLLDLNFSSGMESLDVELFREDEIPWDEIAFPVVDATLRHYFKDRREGRFPVRMFDVRYSPERQIQMQLISQS